MALYLTLSLAAIFAALTLLPVKMPIEFIQANIITVTGQTYHYIAFAALPIPFAVYHPRALFWTVPITVLFGAAIEMVQPLVGRGAEWADFIADLQGIGIGLVIGLSLNRLLALWSKRKARNRS